MSDRISQLSDSSFNSAVRDSDRPVLVDFYADWCAPCRLLAPVLEQLADERDDLSFAKLDVDANPLSAARYGVRSIPTLLVFRDGEPVGSVLGAHAKATLEGELDRVLSPAS